MELNELGSILRRFRLVALTTLLVVLTIGVAAALLPKDRYQTTTTLIVSPKTKQIDFTTVSAIQYLLPSLAAQVGTATFSRETERRAGVPSNGASVAAIIVPGTPVLKIQAEADGPGTAATYANAAAQTLIAHPLSNVIALKVIDPARPPSLPASPNRKVILLTAGVVGLIAALLAALAANAIRPRVRSSSEIRRHLGLEVIGEIPNVRLFPRNTARLFDPLSQHTRLVEAYRRLQTNFQIVAGEQHVVGITSCTAGEGKSAVTANLAWSLASAGNKVLAVDTDLRRPALHEYFAIASGLGVGDLPLGVDVAQVMRATTVPNLNVIAAGHSAQHPTSVIHSALPQILDKVPQDTLILVDMPPVLPAAEATLVATMTRAILLVVDAHHGDPEELDQVLHELRRAGAQILGVVLNRASVKRSRRAEAYYNESPQRRKQA